MHRVPFDKSSINTCQPVAQIYNKMSQKEVYVKTGLLDLLLQRLHRKIRERTFTVSAAKDSIGATAIVLDSMPNDAIAVFHHAGLYAVCFIFRLNADDRAKGFEEMCTFGRNPYDGWHRIAIITKQMSGLLNNGLIILQ